MKIKFTRALLATILCLMVFLATTFTPWLQEYKWNDFLQGFSGGLGAGALIASIHYYNLYRKEGEETTKI
jgi:pantothenate kinase-related protein Tda10